MEMLGKILVIIISMIIISCDYYNAGMDYQDNIALEQVKHGILIIYSHLISLNIMEDVL